LKGVRDLVLEPLPEDEVCCGFGGLFCVKYPEVSNEMVSRKVKNIVAGGADTLLAGDLGCLLNMAGKLSREGHNIRVWHVAEVLAGMTSDRAIGETETRESRD
jgi:L-lactate dehydrogenase complex protein LldE